MTYRFRNIAVAVGLALVAALLTTFYVANYKRHVRQAESTVKVYVAKRDIPQGTPGTELIKQGSITTADVVQRTVVPGAISNIDQVQTLLTTQPIYAGEQVTLRRFASHQQQGIRSQLHGTLRAAALISCSRERCGTATTSTSWRTSRQGAASPASQCATWCATSSSCTHPVGRRPSRRCPPTARR